MSKPSDSDSHGEESCVSWEEEHPDTGTSQDASIGQPGSGEPGRRKGVGISLYDMFFEDFYVIQCGRLAAHQLVLACVGNPVLFSKIPGQVLTVVDYDKKDEPLSKAILPLLLGGRANVNAGLGLRHSDPSKTQSPAWGRHGPFRFFRSIREE